MYLRARYYDPLTQQFLSRDPLEGASGQPYAYAWGNPINYTDPAGLLPGDTQDKVPPRGQVPPEWTVKEQSNGNWTQQSLPGFWDMLRSAGQANAAGSDENLISVGSGKAYSVAFEVELPKGSYPGKSRAYHNQIANGQLLSAMNADAAFAKAMHKLIPGLRSQLEGRRGGVSLKAPRGWTWHHVLSYRNHSGKPGSPGFMHLVPRVQHKPSGPLWRVFHDRGKGGYDEWGE